MRRIALIEFNTWHGECLEPQLEYLKASGCDVTLICPKKTLSAVSAAALSGVRYVECPEKKGIRNVMAVRNALANGRIDVAILNTAQGSEVTKLMLLPRPGKTRFVGTIHNLHKLAHSTGQKIINWKIEGYYVISRHLLPQLKKLTYKPTQYYSPLDKSKSPISEPTRERAAGERWLAIPGSIELKRRSYAKLIDMVLSPLFRNVRFILLCNARKGDGPQFLQKVRQILFLKEVHRLGLEDRFITFGGFVPSATFDAYMRECDYILALIDGDTPNAADYKTTKTSGSFSLAASYGKPLLCDSYMADIEDFDPPHIFYHNDEELAEIINSGRKPEASPRLDFEEERQRYMSLVDSLTNLPSN